MQPTYRSVMTAACTLLTAVTAAQAVPPDPPQPDYVIDAMHLSANSELVVEIANVGLAIGCDDPDLKLSVLVDGLQPVDDIVMPANMPFEAGSNTASIATGIRLFGKHRRISVMVDSGSDCDEENEYQNTNSMNINVFQGQGHDLSLDVEFDYPGHVDQFVFKVENRGNLRSPVNLLVTFGGTGAPSDPEATIPTLNPGAIHTVETTLPAGPGSTYTVTMSFDETGDLDNTNHKVTRRYVTMTDVGAKYDAIFNDASYLEVRDAMLFYPSSCDPAVSYDSWVADMKTRLDEILLGLEQGRGLPIKDVSATTGAEYTEALAEDVYLGHVAQTLWFEVNGPPRDWNLTQLSGGEPGEEFDWNPLLMLDSNRVMDSCPNGVPGYSWRTSGEFDWNPRVVYDFMDHLGMIKATQADTVWALADWYRSHVSHWDPAEGMDHDNPGRVPMDTQMYPLASYPRGGSYLSHTGCGGVSRFMRAALSALGIPVEVQRANIVQPNQCNNIHLRFFLPTVRKTPLDDPGILVSHGDNLTGNRSTDTFGPNVAPSHKLFFTLAEIDKIGVCEEGGAGECDPCDPDILCGDGNLSACYCDVSEVTGENTCCAQQWSFEGMRKDRLVAGEFLNAKLLWEYYRSGPDTVEAWMRGGWGGDEFSEPLLCAQERADFLGELAAYENIHFPDPPDDDTREYFERLKSNGSNGSISYWSDCNANGYPDSFDIPAEACGGPIDTCPGQGSCLAPGGNGSPGCVCSLCCFDVCLTKPDCCSVEWTAECATIAALSTSCDSATLVAASLDCNDNGVPDECEVDCDENGVKDVCEGSDCDGNGTLDVCEVDWGMSPDCNGNGRPDACDVAAGYADCNLNGVPDECDLDPTDPDGNGQTSADCNGNTTPDECEFEFDCNDNGVPDDCDVNPSDPDGNGQVSPDCNGNTLPDECDTSAEYSESSQWFSPIDGTITHEHTFEEVPSAAIYAMLSFEAIGNLDDAYWEYINIALNGTSIGAIFLGPANECPASPDYDQLILDGAEFNGLVAGSARVTMTPRIGLVNTCVDPQSYIIVTLQLGSPDCNANGVPDECELEDNDCNSNDVPDDCDADCQPNGVADECDISGGGSEDCNDDQIPDECQLSETDCDGNGIPDDCDIGNGADDCQPNGIPDVCELPTIDCNDNGTPDDCEPSPPDCYLLPPGLPTIPQHRHRKHRYISINPTTNSHVDTVIKVEIAEMMRCQNDPRRGCLVDEDCRNICENSLNTLCTGSVVCGGGNCIDSGPCVDATPMWDRFSTGRAPVAWLVQEAMQIQAACLAPGCNPANENCCGDEDWVARLSDVPYADSNNWQDHDLIHISDCGISPGITYAVYACDPANINVCSAPLYVGTQQTPSGTHLHFGDIAGAPAFGGAPFEPPDGFVNVVDISAWGLTKQNYGTPASPQLHPTMADLHGSGYGVPANYVLSLSDQQAIINHGFTWALPWDNPTMLGGVDPSTCPGKLP